MYSSELSGGESNGLECGATGPMVESSRGTNRAIECGESVELDGGMSPELVSGDGEALGRGEDFEMDRAARHAGATRPELGLGRAKGLRTENSLRGDLEADADAFVASGERV